MPSYLMNPEKGVMKEFLKKLVNGLKGWYIQAYRWAWPHILKVKPWYDKAALYLNNHPKIKWAAMILSPPFALFVLILLIVWIETPWNSELRNIRNQVASEVYSAD
ncbi:MAG: hypothetical protein C0523_05220, partial [Cytophaga sp.]|nr:hypothetical protein [Cytophaga sp.]